MKNMIYFIENPRHILLHNQPVASPFFKYKLLTGSLPVAINSIARPIGFASYDGIFTYFTTMYQAHFAVHPKVNQSINP